MTAAHVVAALINSTWQSALVALAAALALRLSPRASAAMRCAVWYAALAVVALLPLVDLGFSLAVAPVATQAGGFKVSLHAVTALPRVPSPDPAPPALPLAERAAIAIGAAAPWLERAWMLVALVLGGRLLFDTARLVLAKRRVRPLERAAGVRPGRRPFRIGASDAIEMPCVLGLFDPVVALPAHLAGALSDDDLASVVSHEAAHVERRDDWLHLVERTLHVAFFFNPLVYAIGQRIAVEREIACDDRAVARCGDRVAYASCLARLAGSLSGAKPASVPAFLRGRRQLLARVERVLDGRHDAEVRIGRAGAAFAAIAVVAFVVAHFGIPVRAQAQTTAAPVRIEAWIAPPPRRSTPAPKVHARIAISRPVVAMPPRLAPRIAPHVASRIASHARLVATAPATPVARRAARPAESLADAARAIRPAIAVAQIDAMHEHDVDAAYLRAAVATTHDSEPDHVIWLRDNGITPRYMAGLVRAGVRARCGLDIVRMYQHGVTPATVAFVRRFHARFTVGELVRAADAGV